MNGYTSVDLPIRLDNLTLPATIRVSVLGGGACPPRIARERLRIQVLNNSAFEFS